AKLVDNVFRVVDVAEARASLLAETIVVLDDAPDEEAVLQFIGKHCSDTLRRGSPRRQNNLSVAWLFNREVLAIGFWPASESAVPAHILCRQVPDVPEDNGRMQSIVPISMSGKTAWIDAHVSTLKYSGVLGLRTNSSPRHDPQ